ncbi:hypothetical protein [Sphingomonas bacterium]|uniref:hypothetical protein n=1 Tax=Sphingomonas bacterium TaxID=1895847 RepID=UPI002626F3D3|nr:hypothetical protein [Sphingomonas bacterium]MDB5679648.1 hypothetical protein [Sphingomonas bacterium]
MRRLIMTSCCLAGGLLLASLADARPGIDMQLERSAAIRPTDRAISSQAGLMRRWVAVGRCVVGRDRNASLALVRAPLGSDDAGEAARRLDPIFAGCLAGSGVPGPSSVVLRRAALADALGIAIPRA